MQITEVRLREAKELDRAKAYIDVTFDNEFVVRDIKLFKNERGDGEGYYIKFPSKRIPNGLFKDVAHPINQETRDKIQTAILEQYKNWSTKLK